MANSTTSKVAPAKPAGKKASLLSMGAMAIMIVTTIMSLRGLASQAEFGYTSIFWYVLSAILFLIPFSLVCAELASTYTQNGGLFRWCAEAFGPRWGLTGMYLEWMTVVIWFPSVLMFGAVSLAYVFWPESFDNKLASNVIYTLVIVLAIYWISTLNCLRGISKANKLSTYGGLFGTIIPGGGLLILGIVYLLTGGTNFIPDNVPFWPDFSKYGTIVLAASIFLFYGGMEMQAVHVNQMSDPEKQFPKSVFLAVIIILVVFIGGTLAIGFVMPEKEINLLQSLLVAYHNLFAHLHCEWLGNVFALFITFGVVGQVSVIVAAPSTGLLAVGRAGYLPRGLQKVNKNGVQKNILMVQGVIVTILSLALIVLPDVESAYQILSQMATVIYLLLVILIYSAFFRLRSTEPNVKRGFRVPGGEVVKWGITVVGIAGAAAAMILSFLPPSQISTGSPVTYIAILLVGSAVLTAVPFIVYSRRKAKWHDPDVHFYPFNWMIEGRKPNVRSSWPEGYVPTREQIDRAVEWEEGELGPVSMKTISVINDLSIKPHPGDAPVPPRAEKPADDIDGSKTDLKK